MWTPSLPPLFTTLWLGPCLALYTVAAGALSAWLKARRGLRTGDTRKVFHFAIFTAAALLGRALGIEAVNLLGGVVAGYVVVVLAVGDGNPFYESLAREGDAPRRSLHIVLPFLATAAGGVTSSALFGPHAVVGFAVTGFADAVGEPVGIRWGKHRYRVPTFGRGVKSERSIEGSAAVLVSAFAAAAVVLSTVPGDAAGVPPGLPRTLLVAITIALVVAVVEAVSPHGLDNFTLQIATAWVAWGAAF